MIKKLYCVYDIKACVHDMLFECNADGEATRLISDILSNPNTTLARHPSDYKLYCLAVYDNVAGVISPFSQPILVCDVSSLVYRSTAPAELAPQVPAQDVAEASGREGDELHEHAEAQ